MVNGNLFKRRRLILIFSLVILFPTIIVGILGLRTLAERRDFLEQTLEANLVMALEAALDKIEITLIEAEETVLALELYDPLIPENTTGQAASKEFPSTWVKGRRFLLDAHGQVVFPRIGSEREMESSLSILVGIAAAEILREAEHQEFISKNYLRAADLYHQAFLNQANRRWKAKALEGQARCLKKFGRSNEAGEIYRKLSEDFADDQDGAGHPYGLSAALKRAEILCGDNKPDGIRKILSLYRDIRQGTWILTESAYAFFIEHLQTILDELMAGMNDADLGQAYRDIQNSPALYEERLDFAEFLRAEIAPRIQDLEQVLSEGRVERISGERRGMSYLITFILFNGREGIQNYIAGFCWDLDNLFGTALPALARSQSVESGVELTIVSGGESVDGSLIQRAGGKVEMSFRRFPLPWKVAASQPSILRLRRSAGRDILVFGILLALIIGLMVFGAVLMARDIMRESEINRMKSDFVHNVSHELKTPLTLIQLFSETLQNNRDLSEDDRRDAREIITKESERLTHLINNVLDFSRMELGKQDYVFRKESLASIVRETLEAYRYHLENKRFVLQTDIEDVPLLRLDREAVISVLINLLSNAIKFSGTSRKIRVSLKRKRTEVVLSVEDWGIGMKKAELNRIFNRFYRARSATDTSGSGIGLSLVKHAAEAHGGWIEVSSKPNRGSLFSILFPLKEYEHSPTDKKDNEQMGKNHGKKNPDRRG